MRSGKTSKHICLMNWMTNGLVPTAVCTVGPGLKVNTNCLVTDFSLKIQSFSISRHKVE